MYAGMFGMEHRIYTNWPGRGVTTVLPYLIMGPTLYAARVASVMMALFLAVCSALVLRRAVGRSLRWPDWLTLGAVLTSPVVVVAGRFARPEIDVAAWTMAMIVCLDGSLQAGDARRRRVWGIGGGVCGGIAFAMHQYGLVSLGAGLLMGTVFRRRGNSSGAGVIWWMAVGAMIALAPWLTFVLTDLQEFLLQFGAAVSNQAWRYPASALVRTIINELPGRYLLDRQDYVVDWDPWVEATRMLVPAFSTTEELWPVRLTVRVVRRLFELGPVVLTRFWWLGVGCATLVMAGVEAYRRRTGRAWLLVGLGCVWVAALSLVPNKWLGYAVTPTVLLGLGGYVMVANRLGTGRHGLAWLSGITAMTIAFNLSVISWGWLNAPRSRGEIVGALHSVIPPGARVLIPFREWYAFVGRNPAIALEGRSLPMFGTSLARSAREFGAEYVVFVRDASGTMPFYWVVDHDPLVVRVQGSMGSLGDGVTMRAVVGGEEVIVARVR
jgi:hypothetical protein